MSSFKIRPRFKHYFHGKTEDLEGIIVDQLKSHKGFIHSYLQGHIYIKINPNEQHIWSPQLHLTFEQEEECVVVRGLYGPSPSIWAIFLFGYVVLGLLTLFLGMWGLTKYSLGQDYSILWSVPVLVFLAGGLYLFAQAGQKLGAQQMFDIHHFYEELTHDRIEVE